MTINTHHSHMEKELLIILLEITNNNYDLV